MLERKNHDYMGLNCPAMPGRVRALLWIAALFIALTVGPSGVMAQQDPNDPGNVDVVLVNTDASDGHWDVGLGKSSPVGVTLMWDESITGLEFNFEVLSVTSGDAQVDSVAFTNLLLDEQVLPNRSVTLLSDGVLPDTIKIVATADYPENYLIPYFTGIRTLMFIYLTGLQVGEISIVALDGSVDTEKATKIWPEGQDDWFRPVVASEPVPVIDGGGISFDDPGIRDTLLMEGIVLRTTRSTPVNVRVVNDEEVRYFTGIFAFETVDSGTVQIDSVVWVGRLADRDVCRERRVVNGLRPDGSPVLMVGCYAPHLEPYRYPLPIGDEVLMQIYLTATSPGTIRLDTASTSSVMFRHTSTTMETIDGIHQFCPYFEPVLIDASSDQPPTFTQPAEPIPPAAAGQVIQFVVAAEPETPGNGVDLSLRSLNSWDDAHIMPSVQPDFSPMSGLFSWNPGYDDVGVWRAVFQAADSETGAADTATVRLTIVTGPEYIVPFSLVGNMTSLMIQASGVVHGNFDQDAYQEVVFCPYYHPDGVAVQVFEFDGVNTFAQVSQGTFGSGLLNRGMKAGFFNEDVHLDVVLRNWDQLLVLLGNGDNTFVESESQVSVQGYDFYQSVLSNFNDDEFIDYIALGIREVFIFPGTATGFADPVSIDVGPEPEKLSDKTLFSLNSSDFDGDGWDDLAIGTVSGLWIYINDQQGGYTGGAQYPLDFPPVDISITNAGADFNGDGWYDLCVTLPLNRYYWYSDATRILVYFGNGDGTFTGSVVTTVQGLALASRPGDFNGDGRLDIAFINHGGKYLGMLLGDGTGSFENQLRFAVPWVSPFVIDCLDIDVDGDMDVVVEGTGAGASGVDEQWYYLFVNKSDPAGIIKRRLTLTVQNDASAELVAPNGGRLGVIQNSIPSGEYYRRNVDNNGRLDALASVGSLQHGRYDIVIKPVAVGQPESAFSLGCKIGGQSYRIASDLPIGGESYTFPVYPDGSSPVSPPQGGCVRSEHPMFEWDSIAVPGPDKQSSLPITDFNCDIQFAPDPNFDNILESATVSGTRYYLRTALSVTDTVTFYWRLRPSGATEWGGVFAFNALPVSDYVKDPEDIDSEDGANGAGGGGAQVNPGGDGEGLGDADEAGQVALDLPETHALCQNHPNPFNPRTSMSYSLPEPGRVKLEVFNILGQLVATLVDQVQSPGEYTVTWDATGQASGIYLYRLSTDDYVNTKKMLLLK